MSENSGKGAMRDQMPKCAAFLDSIREVFGGVGVVNDNGVRKLRTGEVWYAIEGEHEIGTPPLDALVRTGRACRVPGTAKRACVVCGVDSPMRRGDRWYCERHY